MRCAICGIVLTFLCPGLLPAQGRIEQIRRDAGDKGNGSSTDDSSNENREPPCSDDEDVFGIGEFVAAIFFSPFTSPIKSLNDTWDNGAYFPDYPYFERHRGHLFFPDHSNGMDRENETIRVREWSIRVAGEEGNDFRGMNRVGIRASLDTSFRLGLTTNWNLLSESLDEGRTDSTWLSDTNVIFRFAQSERAQFYSGAGIRILSDSTATHTGLNFLYGVDFFPRRPITASMLFDLGNVGSAFILHGRATVGATWRHFELYTGYDFMRIGSVNVQGPMLGLRFWY